MIVQTLPAEPPLKVSFDRVFGPESSDDDVGEGLQPLCEAAARGLKYFLCSFYYLPALCNVSVHFLSCPVNAALTLPLSVYHSRLFMLPAPVCWCRGPMSSEAWEPRRCPDIPCYYFGTSLTC